MQTLIFIRHLATENDLEKRYTSYYESSPLVNQNRIELQKFKKELNLAVKKFNITNLYHSGNQRSTDTMDAILDKDIKSKLKVHSDIALRNIEQPEMEGLSFEEIKKRPIFKVWNTTPELANFEGGESLQDVIDRCVLFRKNVRSNSLIISHTTPLQVLLCNEIGLDFSKIWAFKFDHLSFSLIYSRKLLRLNSKLITDCNFQELVLVDQ